MKKLFVRSLLLFIFTSIATQPTYADGPDQRFGIVDAYVNAEEATAAGAGYTRIILRWDIIQPAGRDDWKPANVPDPFIEAELAAGREVVAILIGTPAWASNGVNDSRAVPDMEAWGNFVTRVAQQYQGRIKHWIIWNEPDVWDTDNGGNTWLGTEADYLNLLQVAYNNIKTVDPSMQILLAGLTYHWDAQHGREQYLSRLLTLIAADPNAAGQNYYFDAVSYHLYYKPREMFDILTEIRAMLDSFGLGNKPIWINETNAPPSDDPQESPWDEPQFVVSMQEQANFVIQAYALLIAGGANRIEFYKMRNSADHPEDVEPHGLLRADNSRRPAFAAYQVVSKHFSGYTNYQWVRQGNFYIVTLERRNQTSSVLWNISPQDRPFSINAIAPQATLVDETGAEQTIAAVNGVYTIVLPGASCSAGDCFIGGAPRILIEEGSAEQRASLIPLATNTPTATPLPSDTPMPTPTQTATPTVTPTPPPASESNATPVANEIAILTTPAADSRGQENPASTLPDSVQSEEPQPSRSFFSFITPSRVVFLVLLGIVLFTVIFFLQFKLWSQLRS